MYVTVSPASGSLPVPAGGKASVTLHATAGADDGNYPVSVSLSTGIPQKISTYVFAGTVVVDTSKTVASITLPATVNNGSIGIFAIAAGQ